MEAFNGNDSLFGEDFMVFGEDDLKVFTGRGAGECGREECGAWTECVSVGLV